MAAAAQTVAVFFTGTCIFAGDWAAPATVDVGFVAVFDPIITANACADVVGTLAALAVSIFFACFAASARATDRSAAVDVGFLEIAKLVQFAVLTTRFDVAGLTTSA